MLDNNMELFMKCLIIYESFFGNTEKIAKAIADAVSCEGDDVKCMPARECSADMLNGLDLLIAGSPTRAFSPSQEIKGFLKSIPSGALKEVRCAAFDTRADVKKANAPVFTFLAGIFGYAAKPLMNIMLKKGGERTELEGFFVDDTEGPLREGESARAREWAMGLRKYL